MEDALDFKEELERKTLTALENLLRKHEERRINDDQLEIGMQAVFDCAWGLVGEDINQIIEKCRTTPDPNFVERRLLKNGKRIALIEKRPGAEAFRVRVGLKPDGSWALDKTQSFVDEVNASRVCAEKFEALITNMTTQGYMEL